MMGSLKQLTKGFWGARNTHEGTQVEIQRVYTGLGAEFGQPITYDNITFALKREPVAHRIVFALAHDVFDNWFEVEPLEEGVDKEKFNKAVQLAGSEVNEGEYFKLIRDCQSRYVE